MTRLVVTEAAESQALVTLAEAKTELGVEGTDSDALITAMIAQASAACARACNRHGFGRETLEQHETAPAWRAVQREWIILRRDIEPEVSSVTAGGQELDADAWSLDDGAVLRRVDGLAWNGQGYLALPIVVTYSAGYELPAGAPPDLARACLVTLRGWWHARGRDPGVRQYTAEGVGSVSYGTAAISGAVPEEARGLLEPWLSRALA